MNAPKLHFSRCLDLASGHWFVPLGSTAGHMHSRDASEPQTACSPFDKPFDHIRAAELGPIIPERSRTVPKQ